MTPLHLIAIGVKWGLRITEGFVISIRLLVRYLFFLLILVFYVGNSGFCKQIEVVEKIPFFVD